MNRKERRAKGIKNHDPAFVMKQSDMQSHINRLVYTDPIVQKAIKEEAHRLNLLEAKKQAEDIDALILMTLHDVFGFGKKRLMKYVAGLAELQNYYEDRYEEYALGAIRMHLRDHVGIDVTEFHKEVEEFAKENANKG